MMRKKRATISIFLAGLLLLAMLSGCASQAEGESIVDSPLSQQETETPNGDSATRPSETTPEVTSPPENEPTVPTLTLENSLERKLVILARQDLAERLGIPEEQIQLAGIQEMTWPDASLGCPEPNTVYAQVRTPGYRIILVAESDVYKGEVYQYHTDMEGEIKFCTVEFPNLPNIPVTPGEIDDGIPWMPVK